ncbi:hypothetical protein GQ845_000858 [Salmonella enterica subsp. enterica]|nr:hypothetical protein [Salmonella enterica]EDQ8643161.1 hypothetical protein [Salmonella enterica subsp. enterica serovar Bere]EDT0677574.1 hypothetical protein [Salmonella enterica subsp. enterica]EEJ2509502.1 hypothetical protein [Salmonella enterica subsp. arizonae serovar 47:z4,z23:-]EDT2870514.1 hypothetical protein [Salmonella enterica subsp. enterica serovar Bere]
MLSKTGFTHSDLLCWQIDYAGGSLNVNGTIMRDTYIFNRALIMKFLWSPANLSFFPRP